MTAKAAPPIGGYEITVRPQCGQARSQGAKLLPQGVRRNGLEMLNQPMDAKLRVDFYAAMNVVGHDFKSFCCHFSKHPFAAFCNRTHQHGAPVLGRPYAMVLLEYTTFWFDLYPSSAMY
jgi:hypothetical protein